MRSLMGPQAHIDHRRFAGIRRHPEDVRHRIAHLRGPRVIGLTTVAHHDEVRGRSYANVGMRPYLGARGAWLRQSGDSAGIDIKASGWSFGLVGGINWQVNPKVAIETGVNWNAISFGDVEVDGTSVSGSDSSGNGFAFTTGIVVGLGN